jgi:imidazole glycerol phosphate synthase subunit HisF
MPNTDPQVIAFANTRVRPFADRMFSAWLEAIALVEEFDSGDIATQVEAAGAGEILVDGSATDGRTQITGGDIYNLVNVAIALKAFVENAAVATRDRTVDITKPHVNRF